LILRLGDPVASRTATPPALGSEEKAERGRKPAALAARYRTGMVKA
jgi:hypothetical protein